MGDTAPCHVEHVVAELFVPLLVPSLLLFSGVVVVVAGRQAELVDVSRLSTSCSSKRGLEVVNGGWSLVLGTEYSRSDRQVADKTATKRVNNVSSGV